MDILYVTSFAPDMYHATGRHLVESLVEFVPDGRILCCCEGGIDLTAFPASKVLCHDLDQSEFLKGWLRTHADIIPRELGGAAELCGCEHPSDPWSLHSEGCPYGWFNKNASRWFRKIVSLEEATTNYSSDVMVWLDSDCRFTQVLPEGFWEMLFEGVSALYHKGPGRNVIESGVIAFRMNPAGRRLVEAVIDIYRSGRFRMEKRWDDGYLFQQIIARHPDIPTRDLATGSTDYGFVLPSSPLGRYLEHYKGVHGTVLRLMR